jgi:hypothetical protein
MAQGRATQISITDQVGTAAPAVQSSTGRQIVVWRASHAQNFRASLRQDSRGRLVRPKGSPSCTFVPLGVRALGVGRPTVITRAKI